MTEETRSSADNVSADQGSVKLSLYLKGQNLEELMRELNIRLELFAPKSRWSVELKVEDVVSIGYDGAVSKLYTARTAFATYLGPEPGSPITGLPSDVQAAIKSGSFRPR